MIMYRFRDEVNDDPDEKLQLEKKHEPISQFYTVGPVLTGFPWSNRIVV